jgi:DNA-binding transcriptional LysR family regulator
MTNIPTELLRTLVAVVDLRSFTKAAQSLGVTQPAVSAQIKRLQSLLGSELLDKSAPGVTLTSAGNLVVNYARRLLSINDQILDLAGQRPLAQTVRIGATGDFTAAAIARGLSSMRGRRPDLRYTVSSDHLDPLLKVLREGELDLLVWVSGTAPTQEARYCWNEELVWVRSAASHMQPEGPVPLVSYGDQCLFTRSALSAIGSAGREWEMTFIGSSIAGLSAAVASGLGVTPLPRSCANLPGVEIWEDAPLPKLPVVFSGIFIREGADADDREQIADAIAASLHPGPSLGDGRERGAIAAA